MRFKLLLTLMSQTVLSLFAHFTCDCLPPSKLPAVLPSRSIYILDARGRKRIQPCSQSLAMELHPNRCRSNNKTSKPHEAARQRHRRARALQATEADYYKHRTNLKNATLENATDFRLSCACL